LVKAVEVLTSSSRAVRLKLNRANSAPRPANPFITIAHARCARCSIKEDDLNRLAEGAISSLAVRSL
jgi:hypothetical protein